MAYIYKAGLKGFPIDDDTKLVVARHRPGTGSSTSFGGHANTRIRSIYARATAW